MRYVLIISAQAVHVSIQYPPAVYIVPAAPAVVVVSAPNGRRYLDCGQWL